MDRQCQILFDRVLRPNPPLDPRLLALVLAVVAGLNLVFAAWFVLQGAWPIAPFMGADVALLAWAFRASVTASRREEHLTLTPASLTIARRPGEERIVLNPYWLRVEMEEPPQSRLTLTSHGKAEPVGAFLGAGDRAALAQMLRDALFQARSPPPFTGEVAQRAGGGE